MPRTVRRGRRLAAGGYREHRLAIWGVTGCVAVAAGVALTAGLAAASPQLGNLPGGTTDRQPALAGLPTIDPSATDPLGQGPVRSPGSSGRHTTTPTPADVPSPPSATPRPTPSAYPRR